MFREICFVIIFLNSFHYNVKVNATWMVKSEESKSFMNGFWVTLQKYYGRLKDFIYKDLLGQEEISPKPGNGTLNETEKKMTTKIYQMKSKKIFNKSYHGEIRRKIHKRPNDSDVMFPVFRSPEKAPRFGQMIELEKKQSPPKNGATTKYPEYFETEENTLQYKDMESEQLISSYHISTDNKIPEYFDTQEKWPHNREAKFDDEIPLYQIESMEKGDNKPRQKEAVKPINVQWKISAKPRVSRNFTHTSIKKPHVIPFMKPELSAPHLIASFGFKSETHSVFTSDGYMLTMHRIKPDTDHPCKQAVILHHGLLGSSEDWLILGPGLALPYLLVDKGYDVWLLNARGNKYSKGHTTWYTESYEFWDFTWHEMGAYDLPATITYISDYTKDADLYFVGHSMGASALLVLLSTIPDYNDLIKSAIFLGPLSFMHKAKGPLKQLAEIRRKKGITALNFLGTNEFMGKGEFPQDIVEKFCKGDKKSCKNPLLLLANGGKLLDEDLMYNILNHVPAGGSAMTILHYLQLIKSGNFQMYDYGVQGNLKKYKRKHPPTYDLTSITLPISVFSSPSDWLSSKSDVTTLLSSLKHVYIHHVVKRNDFNHMDFIWAKDAPELVFNLVIDILDQISPMKEKKSNFRDHSTQSTDTTDDE